MTALSQDVEADLRRENARLQAELRAARDRQAGSAEILRTIGSASGDAEASLYQIAKITKRLFEASSVSILVAQGTEWGQIIHDGASSKRIAAEVPVAQLRIGGHSLPGATFSENRQIHLPDIDNVDPAIADWPGLGPARAGGTRTLSGTPLRRGGQAIGVLIVHRDHLAPFTAEELALLQSFADQAAIAIENARLFNQSREALDRQDASADILRTIASSPGDAGRSLQQIAETSARLFGAPSVSLQLADNGEWGQAYRFGDSAQRVRSAVPLASIRIGGRNLPGTVVAENRQIHIPDLDHLDPSMSDWPGPPHARAAGTRTMCGTPLRREGRAIGVLVIYRDRLLPFTPEELALQQSFADQAVIAIENARLFNETREALARQTATSDILRVISQSPTDVQPVFDEIVLTAARLLRCDSFILNHDGATYWCAAMASPQGPHPILAAEKVTIDPDANFPSRAIVGKKNLHVPDWSVIDLPDYERGIREMYGINSALYLPLLREGECIGVLGLARKQAGKLGESETALAESFRDQALIAIENTRLFNETREALERQTATADILKVIASSPSDVQPVFEAIASSSNRLIGGFSTAVFRFVDDVAHLAAFTPTVPAADEILKASFPRPLVDFQPFELARKGEPVQIADTEVSSGARITEIARARGFRSMLFSPLINKGTPIGLISVTRVEPGTFTAHHVQLLQTFADQAVIAVENVRLFEQVQAKTRDLSEALTYQTGSSNILSVIASSPTDVAPVLKAIVESACELCEADDALVVLKDGKDLVFKEQHGSIPVVWNTQPVSRDWVAGRAVVDRKPIHVHDLLSTEGEQFPDARQFARQTGVRTVLGVPLLRENESVGSIVLRRTEVHPFSHKQVALLQTFADQAVIAIGNVRLFEEVQARTRDLSESLQQQTATADVLKVISASPGELEPVFQAMLENAVRLCEAQFAMLFFYEKENEFRAVGEWNLPPAYGEFLGKNTIRADPMVPLGQVAITKQPVQITDVLLHQSYIERYPGMVGVAELGGARTLLQVPMLKENELIGTIGIYRQEVRPFTDKQIALVRNFAAQAVIAIENARLLNELRQRTNDLTTSLEDLRTAQDRLVQTEKLASLGQLTAGIAHEIKNPLNFVNNFAALSAELTDELNEVLSPAPLDRKTREEVDEITHTLKDNLSKVVQHGKRADSIVKNMLLHSREGSGDHRPADINALLDESLNLAYHGARAEKREFNVTLQRDFDEKAGTIEVFPQEITRVFLNLISNGFYAVTKRKLENGSSGFDPVVRATTKNLGDTVEIRIRDNGTGIPAEVKEKMFNPFFTTKPAGEGTGLGLSMSHDIIVKQHGGTIDVATEPGVFTEFRIVLPRASNLSSKNGAQ
jgi:two-component system NtrC family sensor kinase